MVPSLFGVEPVDGVYWTLLLEVQFYILVFLFVLAGRRDTLSALLPWWALGILVLNLAAPAYDSVFPYLGGYFARFAAGALIVEIHHCGLTWLRGIGLLGSAIVAVRFSTRLAAYVTRTEGVEYSPGILTVVLLSFFSVILLLGSDRLQHLKLPGAMTAVALTYPLYFLHANLGYLMLSHVANAETRWCDDAMVVTVMIGLSLLLHVIVEKRLGDTWWRVFEATAGRAVGTLESWIRLAVTNPTVVSGSDPGHRR